MNYQSIIEEVLHQCGLEVLEKPAAFLSALEDFSCGGFQRENKLFRKSLNARMLQDVYDAAQRGTTAVAEVQKALLFRLTEEEGLSQETAQLISAGLVNAVCRQLQQTTPAQEEATPAPTSFSATSKPRKATPSSSTGTAQKPAAGSTGQSAPAERVYKVGGKTLTAAQVDAEINRLKQAPAPKWPTYQEMRKSRTRLPAWPKDHYLRRKNQHIWFFTSMAGLADLAAIVWKCLVDQTYSHGWLLLLLILVMPLIPMGLTDELEYDRPSFYVREFWPNGKLRTYKKLADTLLGLFFSIGILSLLVYAFSPFSIFTPQNIAMAALCVLPLAAAGSLGLCAYRDLFIYQTAAGKKHPHQTVILLLLALLTLAVWATAIFF